MAVGRPYCFSNCIAAGPFGSFTGPNNVVVAIKSAIAYSAKQVSRHGNSPMDVRAMVTLSHALARPFLAFSAMALSVDSPPPGAGLFSRRVAAP